MSIIPCVADATRGGDNVGHQQRGQIEQNRNDEIHVAASVALCGARAQMGISQLQDRKCVPNPPNDTYHNLNDILHAVLNITEGLDCRGLLFVHHTLYSLQPRMGLGDARGLVLYSSRLGHGENAKANLLPLRSNLIKGAANVASQVQQRLLVGQGYLLLAQQLVILLHRVVEFG